MTDRNNAPTHSLNGDPLPADGTGWEGWHAIGQALRAWERRREEDKAWDDFRREFCGGPYGEIGHWGESWEHRREQIEQAYEERNDEDRSRICNAVGSSEDEAWALRFGGKGTP